MPRPIPLLLVAFTAACAAAPPPEAATGAASAAPGTVELVGAGVVSTEANEYNPSLAPDGRTLVFARSGPDFRDAKILVSRLEGGRWSAPEPVSFSDPRYTDSDPTLSADGRHLFFVSDRPAPGRDSARADLDLWRADRVGGGWGAPVHLGGAVNTRGQELGPLLFRDTLYFASARRSGRGGLDLYAAPVVDGRPGAPSLLSDALNTAASESDPELSRDGRTLLFWSDRPGSEGADVYLSRRGDSGEWSAPVRVEGGVSAAGFDFTPSFSPDGRWLYFASDRAAAEIRGGEANVYRVRLRAPFVP
ncbi:MAG TPA: hypothetical protein VHG91_21030 [Longimicrobium sp.]|nr:hypothetical protein [Longimicrobium sp.]